MRALLRDSAALAVRWAQLVSPAWVLLQRLLHHLVKELEEEVVVSARQVATGAVVKADFPECSPDAQGEQRGSGLGESIKCLVERVVLITSFLTLFIIFIFTYLRPYFYTHLACIAQGPGRL